MLNRERQLERIERYERQALELGDLKTAIKLNWLRNAVRFDGLDVAESMTKMMEITLNEKAA